MQNQGTLFQHTWKWMYVAALWGPKYPTTKRCAGVWATWMHENRELVWRYGIRQSQHWNNDNNYNDDYVMCVSVWFEFFDGLL